MRWLLRGLLLAGAIAGGVMLTLLAETALMPALLVGGAAIGVVLGVAIAYKWARSKNTKPTPGMLVDAALFGGALGMIGAAALPVSMPFFGPVGSAIQAGAAVSGATAGTAATSILVADGEVQDAESKAFYEENANFWLESQRRRDELERRTRDQRFHETALRLGDRERARREQAASKGLVGALEQRAR